MAHKFFIRRDRGDEFRVSFEYNGEKIFFTEGYSDKRAAKNAIDSILTNGPAAEVVDES